MIQLPLLCIGRTTAGNLALGTAETPPEFLTRKDIAGGVVIDVYEVQSTIERMVIQMQGVAKFKAPIAINGVFAVTFQEAEEVLFFLRDPAGYDSDARQYLTD